MAKSWACGLVRAVAAEAVRLQRPTVIADMRHGQAYLVILNCGHALQAWPLEVKAAAADEHMLALRLPLQPGGLTMLVVTDPYSSSYNIGMQEQTRIRNGLLIGWLSGRTDRRSL